MEIEVELMPTEKAPIRVQLGSLVINLEIEEADELLAQLDKAISEYDEDNDEERG